jgi:predicted regulator of Ras-like GTPase activity (Roadblock/LC7/MglB family)
MLGAVDADQAIADLTEISPQVREVAVIGAAGTSIGSNAPNEATATRLVEAAKQLVVAADALRPGISQLEVATVAGSVFVVRDGERLIAATTTPEPTVGLVFYDLKTCLRSVDEPKPAAKRPRAATKKKEDDDAPA